MQIVIGGPMGTDNQKLPGLQAGRAMAALTVAYFHSYIALRAFPESAQMPIGPLKEWGFLGVNFFFAINGYVICLIASKPTFSVVPFAINRAFRLFPMYWVSMAAIAFLIVAGKYRPEPLGHFLYSMTLLPQSGASAYDVSWTLERELVFYTIAAVVVPLGGVRALAAALASLGLAGWYFGNPWSFHLVSTFQFDFLAGVMVFLIQDRVRRAGAVAPIAIGIVFLAYTRTHDFTGAVAISMGLILLGMINLRLPWQQRPFSWIVQAGNASYSIYLLHYLTFAAMVYIAARLGLRLDVRTLALHHAPVVLPRLFRDVAGDRASDDCSGAPVGRQDPFPVRSPPRCRYCRSRSGSTAGAVVGQSEDAVMTPYGRWEQLPHAWRPCRPADPFRKRLKSIR